jgi:4-nitrophenyl phosphatase
VVYRGGVAIPGASDALLALHRASVVTYFITNNSTRTPEASAARITEVTGVEVPGERVLTSPQAALTLLDPDDAPIFVVGESGITVVAEEAGYPVTDQPEEARAVLVGLTRDLSYGLLAAAMAAIRNGARFIATNDDTTFPTETGLAPGAGAIVAALSAATEVEPEVAGKPNPAMRDLIRSRVPGPAWIVGDRIDTDILMAAAEPAWRSILVMTGVTGDEEAAGAGADHVVADLTAAVELVLDGLERS